MKTIPNFLGGVALVLATLLICPQVRAQNVRIGDGQPSTIERHVGGIAVVSPEPNTTINICGYPAVGLPCTNKITTYADSSVSTPCPSNSQVVLQGTSSCVTTSDAQGNWGAWVPSGTIYTYTFTIGGISYGPFFTNSSSLGISTPLLLRDCRLDGVKADGVTNDSAAVNSCIATAYLANQNHVIFPAGNILLNSPINATNMPGMLYQGAGETFTATPVPTQQTVFFCNTGAVCFDTTGSGEIRLQDLGFRIKNSFSTPSTVDILMGRDAAAGASGTYCFAQNNQLVNVSVWNDHSGSANGGDGYIGLYNVGAESGWISSSFFSGDTSLFFTATNVDNVISPFQTLFTGCAASMSQWTIQQTSVQANSSNAQPAVKTSDAYAFHWNTDSFVGNNTRGYAFATNGSTSTWSMTNIDFEGFGVNSGIFNMNGNVDGLDLDVYTGNAGAGTTVIGLGANNLILSNAKIRTRNVTGTAPGLINNNTGTVCKNCDIDISGTTNPTAYSNVTISGGLIRANSFTDTQVNNFNAASFYQVMDSTGQSYVGKITLNGGATSTATGIYTSQMNLYNQVLLGGINPATEFTNFQNGAFATEAFTAGLAMPLGATVHQGNAIGFYATSACNSSTRTICNTTPAYFSARAIGTGAAVWGGNCIVGDSNGVTGANLTCLEADVNVVGTPSFVRGIVILGCNTCVNPFTGTIPSDGIGLEIGRSGTFVWPMGLRINRGAMQGTLGIVLDGQNTTNNTNSNAIAFLAYDNSGVKTTAAILSNPGGPLQLQPGVGNAVFVNNAGVQVPVLTVATLPTCGAGLVGTLSAVSDATAPTYNGTLTGGGAVKIPVYCNGASWTAH